ncbi:MAG: polyphosphate kinase 1 [Planctomycetota bacterium]
MKGNQAYQPEHFINRELSWLEFNARVLEEAVDESNPLLERAKFLAIFSSNLDEFFMVRVAGLREQAFGGVNPQDGPADGLFPAEQLVRIAQRTRELVDEQSRCWTEQVRPALADEGCRLLRAKELDKAQKKQIAEFFRERAFPILTPMAIDPSHPSPKFHNRGLYLGSVLRRTSGLGPSDLFAVVQIPQVLPRLVRLGGPGETVFIPLEEVLAWKLPELFGGYESDHHALFRVTRDMDLDLLERESDDMLQSIESRLRARQHSSAVRLEVQSNIGDDLLDMLVSEEQLHDGLSLASEPYSEVYPIRGMLDLTCLWELVKQPSMSSLLPPPVTPRVPLGVRRTDDLFAEIADRDILLHHPFESFDPVVSFIERAAEDPDVLAIKQTLYRTSGDSPIVRALIDAAENGKHVTALVELKARFDEANNITWARQMEQAGVHVVYGFMDLKTHCKLAMVVRQEGSKVRRYLHLGTGNYNPTTAKIYTDIGLFTADKQFADDATALFNFLTGYSQGHEWKKLIVAPQDLHSRTLELIDEQTKRAEQGKRAQIFAKLNSLVDRGTIEALYRASTAGVSIDLVVRGICCLRPGLPGISENIRVRSIVDRFLEHSRVFVFGTGQRAQVFVSSADWMPRNFWRRVEVMFPVEDPRLKKRIVEEIAAAYLRDSSRARVLTPEGDYQHAVSWKGDPQHRAQVELMDPSPRGSKSSRSAPGGKGPFPRVAGDQAS